MIFLALCVPMAVLLNKSPFGHKIYMIGSSEKATRYSGVDTDNRPVGALATGFHAGVVQHEYDHLDGILYPMRMNDFTQFGFNEELARAQLAPTAGAPASGRRP